MQPRRATFDLLVCLSLCNLLLLRVWAQLLPGFMHPANLYYMKHAPQWIHYPLALLALFSMSAAVAWGVNRARGSENALARGAGAGTLLLLFLLAGNSIAAQFAPGFAVALEGDGRSGAIRAAAIGALALCGIALWRRPRLVVGSIEACAVFAAPFVALTVGQALWSWVRYDPLHFAGADFSEPVPADWLGASRGPRVVWIVFDELDQRVSFETRPEGLALPAFDGLRAESLMATAAHPPAPVTRLAISSLLLGRAVTWAQPSGVSALACSTDGAPPSDAVADCWAAPSVFDVARASGRNSAIAGWYHPYCRLFAPAVSDCVWAGLPYWDSASAADSLDQLHHEVVKAIPLARLLLRPGARIRGSHLAAYEAIFGAALRQVADPRLDLVFVHLPVPHHPDIYDPVKGELSIRDRRSYLDNLALADRSLAGLRHSMEAAGLWVRSNIIVTSDHGWRAIHRGDWGLTPLEWELFGDGPDRRVPLLIKPAGGGRAATYAEPFNTLVLHDLALALLAGDLESSDQIAGWLDAKRGQVPVPAAAGEAPDRHFSPR